MKYDLKWQQIALKDARKGEGRPGEGGVRRTGGEQLEERDSLCRLVRRMQREERGGLQGAIQKEQLRQGLDKARRIATDNTPKEHLSLFNSRRSPKVTSLEGGQSVDLCFAASEAKKSLVIKNLHLSTSPSNEQLFQHRKLGHRSGTKGDQLSNLMQLNLRGKLWKQKHRDRYLPWKEGRMRTEGDADVFSPKATKEKMNKKESQVHTIQESLCQNQGLYLKIKKIPFIFQCNKLYFTDNPNVLPDTPKSFHPDSLN